MNADVERINVSESTLIERIRSKRDEATVVEALKELVLRKPKGRENVLAEVLKDREYSTAARRVVAIELGKERLPENQTVLIEQIDMRDEKLFAAVAESLGRIGDEKALAALEKASAPDDNAARRTLNFAQSLLSYRLRLDRHLLSVPSAGQIVEAREAVPFEISQPKTETMTRAMRAARASLPAVPLAEETATLLTCQENELVLVLTEGFDVAAGLQSLSERSALPLVLLKQAHSLEQYMLDTYFFTQPDKKGKGITLLGTRPSGALTYVGSVQLTAQTARFTLRSVETRYAPAVEIEGTYSVRGKSFKFDRALYSVTVAAREKPAPVPRPAARPVPTKTSR